MKYGRFVLGVLTKEPMEVGLEADKIIKNGGGMDLVKDIAYYFSKISRGRPRIYENQHVIDKDYLANIDRAISKGNGLEDVVEELVEKEKINFSARTGVDIDHPDLYGAAINIIINKIVNSYQQSGSLN